LTTDEIEFHHLPCHRISVDFPTTLKNLQEYDVILISDVGANTFLLPIETFLHGKKRVNKLSMLKDFVLEGGGLCMVGGYLSFMGIEGKGKYHDSKLEEVLPVNFLTHDDRQEHPEGLEIAIDPATHQIFTDMPTSISGILGYNKAIAKKEGTVIATVENDPFIVLGEYGKGRSIAYATDCAPHWSSPEFCESSVYSTLWQNMVKWLSKRI